MRWCKRLSRFQCLNACPKAFVCDPRLIQIRLSSDRKAASRSIEIGSATGRNIYKERDNVHSVQYVRSTEVVRR